MTSSSRAPAPSASPLARATRNDASRASSPGFWAVSTSAAALALLGVSGYLGGKLAYRYGVRVAAESVQAEGDRGSRTTT
ncbi:DUF2231 domain-containing protein [Streptomyces sp. HGB0020]|uniref:DUF2231 domain-containing protein n=1 Tax=Streptomyces sp. HGB0020 TaxID=1078086 RepID=UPI001319CA09|nr:DUF2231 domain-containing protein [Streptomyces sp. HGB0020]